MYLAIQYAKIYKLIDCHFSGTHKYNYIPSKYSKFGEKNQNYLQQQRQQWH